VRALPATAWPPELTAARRVIAAIVAARVQEGGRIDETFTREVSGCMDPDDHIVDVRMPKTGRDQLGTVHRVAVGEGDLVRQGDLLAEVEIDKAIIDITSPVANRVACLLGVAEGGEVTPGAGIVHIRRADGGQALV
jgi:acetyl/propionyl-CoA carboxylase alpha subunit